MMCDFNKTFNLTKEELEQFTEKIRCQQTKDMMCCACSNSAVKEGLDMNYRTIYTFCTIYKIYRDYQNGTNCPYWNPKYPQYENKTTEERINDN